MTSLDWYFNSLPPDIKEWAIKHIKQVCHSAIPTAGVQLTDKGYVLHLGETALALTGEVRNALLMHEFAHIWRGDCLRTVKQLKTWNVAADAPINYKLLPSELEQLRTAFGGAVTWEELKAELPNGSELPNIPPSTQVIYDLLVQSGKEFPDDQHVLEMDGEREECEKHHIRAVLDMPKGVGADLYLAKNPKRQKVMPKSEPRALSALRRTLQRINPKDGPTRARTRSWMREGRVTGMRGSVSAPRHRVVCALDVSGSMQSLIPQMLSIAAGTNRDVDCRLMLWATSAQWISSADQDADVGGGTSIAPALHLAKSWNPSAVIIITDGEFYEMAPTEGMPPIIWLLTQAERSKLNLRPGDFVIELEGEK